MHPQTSSCPVPWIYRLYTFLGKRGTPYPLGTPARGQGARYLVWDKLDDNVWNVVILGFQKVECLHIFHCTFRRWAQMNQLIASFPSLAEFSCPRMLLETDGVQEVPLIPLPHHLTTITLDVHLSIFFVQLLSLELHPTVHIIAFERLCLPEHRWHIREIGMLLKTLGSNLEHLHLSGCDGDPDIPEGQLFFHSHHVDLTQFYSQKLYQSPFYQLGMRGLVLRIVVPVHFAPPGAGVV